MLSIRFNSKNCRACWKCVEICPEKVFGKINIIVHKHARIVDGSRCKGCLRCVKACDYGAINPVTKYDNTAGRSVNM